MEKMKRCDKCGDEVDIRGMNEVGGGYQCAGCSGGKVVDLNSDCTWLFEGKGVDEVRDWLKKYGYELRVTEENRECGVFITQDIVKNRLNVHVVDGKITKVTGLW